MLNGWPGMTIFPAMPVFPQQSSRAAVMLKIQRPWSMPSDWPHQHSSQTVGTDMNRRSRLPANDEQPKAGSPSSQVHPSISMIRMVNDRFRSLQSAERQPSDRRSRPVPLSRGGNDDIALQFAIRMSLNEAQAPSADAGHGSDRINRSAVDRHNAAAAGPMRLKQPETAVHVFAIRSGIKAFNTIVRGHRRYFRKADVAAARAQPRLSPKSWPAGEHLFSEMAKGNRRMRKWLERRGLETVQTSGYSNNCMLDALMKLASCRHTGDFRARACALKRELVALFPDEVPNERAMLDASSDSPAFQYALARINRSFNTDMEVFVVQAGRNGLPVFAEGLPDLRRLFERVAAGTTPVILYNSGAHYEPIVPGKAAGRPSR